MTINFLRIFGVNVRLRKISEPNKTYTLTQKVRDLDQKSIIRRLNTFLKVLIVRLILLSLLATVKSIIRTINTFVELAVLEKVLNEQKMLFKNIIVHLILFKYIYTY